jgi:hypothetical protein
MQDIDTTILQNLQDMLDVVNPYIQVIRQAWILYKHLKPLTFQRHSMVITQKIYINVEYLYLLMLRWL